VPQGPTVSVPPDQLVTEAAFSCGCNAREGDALKGDFPNSVSPEADKSCVIFGVRNVALTSWFVVSRIPGRLSWWRATHSNCPSEGCDVAVEEPDSNGLLDIRGTLPGSLHWPQVWYFDSAVVAYGQDASRLLSWQQDNGWAIRLRDSNISDASQPPARARRAWGKAGAVHRRIEKTGRAGGCSSGTTTTSDRIRSMTPHPAAQIRRINSREL
jgi:hypothetical protein